MICFCASFQPKLKKIKKKLQNQQKIIKKIVFFVDFLELSSSLDENYTANVLTIETTGTGNCGVPVGKICTLYGKGL
jgi:hypothetical protein